MQNESYRIKPINYRLNCSEELQTRLRPYFQVCTDLSSRRNEVGGLSRNEARIHENIDVTPSEKNTIDLVLRDSVTEELIGRSTINLNLVSYRQGAVTEWFLLRDLLGIEVGKVMVELECRSMIRPGEIRPSISNEELIEELREGMAELMLETNMIFNEMSKKHFPDLSSYGLQFFDTPQMLESVEHKKKRHGHRKHKKAVTDATAHQPYIKEEICYVPKANVSAGKFKPDTSKIRMNEEETGEIVSCTMFQNPLVCLTEAIKESETPIVECVIKKETVTTNKGAEQTKKQTEIIKETVIPTTSGGTPGAQTTTEKKVPPTQSSETPVTGTTPQAVNKPKVEGSTQKPTEEIK